MTLVAFLPGCSTSWKLRTSPPPQYPLQWPYAPNRAKVTFDRALTGLTASATAGRALAAIAYGAEPADANAFVLPVAAATAGDGRIAVADMGRACVHLFVPAEARYVRLTGPKQEPIRTPVSTAFDDEMRLYVSDSSGRVYAFGADGKVLFVVRSAGNSPLRRPTGLAFSKKTKRLYVADTLAHTVYGFDGKGEMVIAMGGRGDGDGQFNFPTHIAWAPTGELFVADSLNFRIQILDEQGKFLGAFGQHGDGSGDFAMPKGLAVDKDGVVYVADSLFDVVQLFDRRGEFLLTLGRRGTDLGEF
ncbi:MAG TPA: 6-bladed beta-propeller, partial [Thermoanaerobaculia bacterium]|nr:6-bladed beta-propeller [Thermoanaerobaculia bacterium]